MPTAERARATDCNLRKRQRQISLSNTDRMVSRLRICRAHHIPQATAEETGVKLSGGLSARGVLQYGLQSTRLVSGHHLLNRAIRVNWSFTGHSTEDPSNSP
jgi:hypothetical protein